MVAMEPGESAMSARYTTLSLVPTRNVQFTVNRKVQLKTELFYHPIFLTVWQHYAILATLANIEPFWPMTDEPGNSILDRVLQSQQTEALEHFEPSDIINDLLKQLNPKESDVIRRRFGLGQHESETLETIGQTYKVTRERVRQIQRWAVGRLKKTATTKQRLHSLDALLQQLLEDHGGIMAEEDLLSELHRNTTVDAQSRAAMLFLLQELMIDKVERIESREYKPYWKLKFSTPRLLTALIATGEKVITEAGKPLGRERLLDALKATAWWKEQGHELSDEAVMTYLGVATSIEKNPYNEFGLRSWGSIVPKRMNDKILLVMRKHGQPMHFQEITQKINETGFDSRQAYPPTVHNELILNKEYVLVGRGIYALKEWGYKPGVVADVIIDVLRVAQHPMTRDEIVAAVLKQRMVKRNTIHLALTNKKIFLKRSDGAYELALAETAVDSRSVQAPSDGPAQSPK